jgi:predicted enzyme related to lactoylglutathione lyase
VVISGVHFIVFSPVADEVRAFFRDTLGWPHVDAGDGWLIFALPPAELAVHPDDHFRQEMYLICDDLEATVAALEAKGVRLSRPISEQRWGRLTTIALPGGAEIALYQPTHSRPGTGIGPTRTEAAPDGDDRRPDV